MLKIGILGLPNVGKSTLFNAVTNSEIEAANYPFATIEPNTAIVDIIDERLDDLASKFESQKTIYNKIMFVDIAGIVRGASKGEGLGSKFLSNVREVDALIHVIRAFENSDIVHVDGSVDPKRDIETIELELMLSDLEQINNWLSKNEKRIMSGNGVKSDLETAKIVKECLESEKLISTLSLSEPQEEFIQQFNFLTKKKMIYVANLSEDEVSNPQNNVHFQKIKELSNSKKIALIPVSAQIEYEISKLNNEEKSLFLDDLGLEKSGLDIITKKAFDTLGLETYFTAGKQEARAWQINKNTKAPQAAGKIHTDFEKGFIKAEIYSYSDFVNNNKDINQLKNNGKIRLEGKDYIVNDGDVINFRFNN